MERLTIDEAINHAKEVAKEKYNEGFLCHANPDDGELNKCIECAKEHEQLALWLEELKSYKTLEEQGLLVRLPCKPGDDVYVISLRGGRHIVPAVVLNISFLVFSSHSKNATDMVINVTTKSNKKIIYHLEDIGKVMFLNREEAEKKLEEMKKNE